ncbi:MliC family protein [Pontixanthobacter sp. CEM42]|uniref:MliC family protein n=1 Tax=Pontixanthobacter sp. CEM42 TaxID=2792077 RepID=UPI001ADFE39D|nr:MliC family protein [Pontixanthobacter sp. CEM42]
MIGKFITSGIIGLASMAALPTAAHASFDDQFVCESIGDVDLLVIISSRDSSNASVQFSSGDGTEEGEPTLEPMRQVVSASGMKYAGLGLIFHSKGGEGTLETEAGSTTCRFAGEEAEEWAEALDIQAWSWGGIVRAGPGMEFDRVTSLREGTPVTLRLKTGEMMNGYPWFMIRLPDGREAYQWGGILCTDSPPIDGTFAGDGCP